MRDASTRARRRLVYEGVLYVITGANDVFASTSRRGAILWTYAAKLDADDDGGLLRLDEPRRRASATARCSSASSTASSSRSTSAPARSCGRSQAERWQDGFTITARRSTTTAW